LGIVILLGALIVKVPQILKIVGAKSAKGISLTSMLLEMLMYVLLNLNILIAITGS
jgi:mannose-P-dolichol utilization defect protein 1